MRLRRRATPSVFLRATWSRVKGNHTAAKPSNSQESSLFGLYFDVWFSDRCSQEIVLALPTLWTSMLQWPKRPCAARPAIDVLPDQSRTDIGSNLRTPSCQCSLFLASRLDGRGPAWGLVYLIFLGSSRRRNKQT